MVELGLIGVGSWGRNFIKTIAEIPDCRLKYVAATSQRTLDDLNGDFIKIIGYQPILEDKTLDGVIVATPASTHFSIVKKLLEVSKNVLVEKPVTLDLKEAEELLQLKQEKKCVVLVGHTLLYSPAYQALKTILTSIGDIRYVKFEGMNNGPFRDDCSVLWDWGPHGIAHFVDLMGNQPIIVNSWGLDSLKPGNNLQESMFVRIKYPNNVAAFMDISWLSPIKKRCLTIGGSKSTVVFDDLQDKKLILYKDLGPTVKTSGVLKHEPSVVYPSYDDTSPLTCEVMDFIACIKGKSEPKSNLRLGVEVTRILSTAEKSLIS